jgi:hypothetical protein
MSHENLESARPVGSFSAKIRFVLGYLSIEEAIYFKSSLGHDCDAVGLRMRVLMN